MKFDILTIFPDIVYGYAGESILKRAQKAGLIKVRAHNFRDYTKDKQRHVDDNPYGGGPGMVLQIQPIYDCLKSIKALSLRATKGSEAIPKTGRLLRRSAPRNDNTKIIILDPAGKKFDQRMAEKLAKLDRLVLICGRYEGFDERIYKLADEKISVGDYVLSGGELPALTIVEAVSRLIPGVLGNEESLTEETFGKLKYPITNVKSSSKSKNQKLEIGNWKLEIAAKWPRYTRPENFMGLKVPKVLLSGNHKLIESWRKKHAK